MSDFTNSKSYGTSVYPVHAAGLSALFERSEPLLTPELLKTRYLKGIPLTFPNGDTYGPEELKDEIKRAMNQAELLLGRTIVKAAIKQKVPFDYSLYRSYIHIKTEHGPITSIEELAIVSADGNNIFNLPAAWIEPANFAKNLINVIPLLAAYGVNSVQGAVGNAGIAFLTVMDGLNWVPAYWQVKYSTSLSNTEGQIPIPVNELIGCIAAIAILSSVQTSNIYNSQSLSQDGISQSSSGPGPKVYEQRIADLTMKKDTLVNKLKAIFSSRYFVDNF